MLLNIPVQRLRETLDDWVVSECEVVALETIVVRLFIIADVSLEDASAPQKDRAIMGIIACPAALVNCVGPWAKSILPKNFREPGDRPLSLFTRSLQNSPETAVNARIIGAFTPPESPLTLKLLSLDVNVDFVKELGLPTPVTA